MPIKPAAAVMQSYSTPLERMLLPNLQAAKEQPIAVAVAVVDLAEAVLLRHFHRPKSLEAVVVAAAGYSVFVKAATTPRHCQWLLRVVDDWY